MAKNTRFIEGIVDDYDEIGLGVKVDATTLAGPDGEGEISFEPLTDKEGHTIGLIVFSDGVQVNELDYEDENFNAELLKEVTGALNL